MVAGKLPQVSDLVAKYKSDALDRCKGLLEDVYETALKLLKEKMPSATYRDILDTVEKTGELKAFRDGIADDERGTTTGQGSTGQAGQGTNKGDTRGPALRVA